MIEILKVSLNDAGRERELSLSSPPHGTRPAGRFARIVGSFRAPHGPPTGVELRLRDVSLGRAAPAAAGSIGRFAWDVPVVGTAEFALEIWMSTPGVGPLLCGTVWIRASPPESASEPLVSIVIPCFNQARFLADAIESATRQTYPNIEILIVDDESFDNTSAVARRFPGVDCVRITHGGVSFARNFGASKARGEALVFLDADDCLEPNAVEDGLCALASKRDAAFAFGRFRVVALDGRPLQDSAPRPAECDAYAELLRGNSLTTTGAAMFRRAAFEAAGGFDPKMAHSEDYDLYMRLASRWPVVPHEQFISRYRRHGAGAGHNALAILRGARKALRKQRQARGRDPSLREAHQAGRARWAESYGPGIVDQLTDHWRRKSFPRAVRDLLGLVAYYPKGLRSLAGSSLD